MDFALEVRTLQKELDRELRRRDKDLFNRLWSIKQDADFVSHVADTLDGLPLIVNLRCGAWYAEPRRATASSYFKSTDGHTGQWAFSLKRHNLGLIELIKHGKGCIIVDSTRSGKTMPDALSKTIPIWCAVLNAASSKRHGCPSRDTLEQHGKLKTPRDLVALSEHAQMESRIEAWSEHLLSSELNVPSLSLPLRPYFVTPDTDLLALSQDIGQRTERAYLPVVLVSASRAPSQASIKDDASQYQRRVSSSKISDSYPAFEYVQGSGDDHENWALGLTPALFWANQDRILQAHRGGEIETLIKEIVAGATQGDGSRKWVDLGQGHENEDIKIGRTGLALGVVSDEESATDAWKANVRSRYALVIRCDGPGSIDEALTKLACPKEHSIQLGLKQGKAGAGAFGFHLAAMLHAMISRLAELHGGGGDGPIQILLCDSVGRDLSPSLAVALLAACYGADQQFLGDASARRVHQTRLDKDQIRRRLQWVMDPGGGDASTEGGLEPEHRPGQQQQQQVAGPARVYLNRVNAVLLAAGRRLDYEPVQGKA